MKVDAEKIRVWILIGIVGLMALFGVFTLVMYFVALFKYGDKSVIEIPSWAYLLLGRK